MACLVKCLLRETLLYLIPLLSCWTAFNNRKNADILGPYQLQESPNPAIDACVFAGL